jgi:hypothetical protein
MRKQRESINAPVFPNPVASLHMIGMGVLRKAGSLRLLGSESPC